MPNRPVDPPRTRSILRNFIGVAIVLALVAALDLLDRAGATVPNPPALLMLALIYAAFAGGLWPGILSAALSWLYVAWHFSIDALPFRYTDENLVRVLIWAATMPIAAILVGIIHKRAVHAAADTENRRVAAISRRNEENRRLVVEHAHDAVVTIDEHGTITDWNPAAEKSFGRLRADAVGRSFAATVLPELARAQFNQRFAALRHPDAPADPRDRYESVALRADGTPFQVEISLFPLHANGSYTACVFIRDISERRAADRRHDVMMRELDHRVKNNLAAVLSIVDQTAARSANLDDFMRNLRGRVMAMARLHSSLAASRWSGADLRALVRQTLDPYTQDTEGRVVIRGPGVTLPAPAVSSVCMALHELATNASRYGALSVPEGRVLVEWNTAHAADGKDHLCLRWSEEGGPPVDAPSRYGFGRQLIEEGVRYEAGGRTNLTFSPTGVTCELVVPLDAPLASSAAK